MSLGIQAIIVAIILTVVLAALRVVPFSAGTTALAFAMAAVVQVPLVSVMNRR